MGILDFGRATKLSGSREHPGDLLRAAGRSPARVVTVHRSMFPPAGRLRSRASPSALDDAQRHQAGDQVGQARALHLRR